MKKTELVRRLGALYKDMPTPRWLQPEWADDFLPCPAGRRVVQVSPEATLFLLKNICGRNSKSGTFIMIEPEGDIRRSQAQVFEDWAQVVRIALDEGSYIYNARSKKCCRPIWHPQSEKRGFESMTFEPVRLIAHEATYNANVPRINTKLFEIGDL